MKKPKMTETEYLLSTKANRKRLKQSIKQAEQGNITYRTIKTDVIKN